MTLMDYMRKNKITREQLAKDLGYSMSAIKHLFLFYDPVTAKFAHTVELYTKGEIKAKDLIKRSIVGKKKRADFLKSAREVESETSGVCYGLCKMCNKKLNEIEL